MKMKIALAAAMLIAAPVAFAQDASKPANTDANTPAVATPGTTNLNAPVEGANSFTEEQARKRILDAGFTEVTGLQKDGQGVWRGKATKNGKSNDVSLDFQGNVATK